MSPAESTAAGSLWVVTSFASAVWKLGRDVAWSCAWRSVRAIPLAAVMAVSLMSASAVWILVSNDFTTATTWQRGLALGTLASFTIAGCLWGTHRALRAGIEAGIGTLQQQAPQLVDSFLAPLTGLLEGHCPQLAVVDLRRFTGEATSPVCQPKRSGLHPIRWAMGALVRWWLRAEIAAISRLLDRAEAQGETHISLPVLRRHVSEECSAHVVQMIHGQLRRLDLAVAAILFALLVLPPSLLILCTG